mmetsp:Transcript_16473/g.46159  ORF Transcript_16473/g.46159 Transcript_16473/m.46159 type:complete len:144 (+) Transcript_16473:406-837(+)
MSLCPQGADVKRMQQPSRRSCGSGGHVAFSRAPSSSTGAHRARRDLWQAKCERVVPAARSPLAPGSLRDFLPRPSHLCQPVVRLAEELREVDLQLLAVGAFLLILLPEYLLDLSIELPTAVPDEQDLKRLLYANVAGEFLVVH